MIGEEVQHGAADDRQQGGSGERPHQRTANGAAQMVEIVGRAVFGDEADDAGLEAETGDPAQDYRGDPYGDIDAVFEIAHPARHEDLAEIGNRGTCDANGKGENGRTLRYRTVVAAAQNGIETV